LLPLAGLIIGRLGKLLRKQSLQAQRKLGSLNTIVEETLGGLRIIKAFNSEKKINQKYSDENNLYTHLLIKVSRRNVLAIPLSEFLGTLVVLIVMWIGGSYILGGSSDLSSQEFMAYLVIFSQIINPAKSFSSAYYSIQKGLASADRIDQILKAENTIVEKGNAISIKEFKDSIEYKNVSFKYTEYDVLKKINLKIEKGKTIAIVGQSGSGKSTLVDLLPRFFDIDRGEILLDGISIKDYKVFDLRNLMGNVNQESILFNDTIYNNIAFGVDNTNEEQVIAAAKVANAHDFIMATSDQYQSNIGDRGSKLSGGQRQRISIARAVLKNPPIMILDEATSALDTESERLVQDALNKLMENRTSIVIAHRLSTVIHADEICVLYEGKIVERGRHSELLIKGGTYKKLHDLQMFS
jgi:subfamily B ATP-binding cassette protein MsbA